MSALQTGASSLSICKAGCLEGPLGKDGTVVQATSEVQTSRAREPSWELHALGMLQHTPQSTDSHSTRCCSAIQELTACKERPQVPEQIWPRGPDGKAADEAILILREV